MLGGRSVSNRILISRYFQRFYQSANWILCTSYEKPTNIYLCFVCCSKNRACRSELERRGWKYFPRSTSYLDKYFYNVPDNYSLPEVGCIGTSTIPPPFPLTWKNTSKLYEHLTKKPLPEVSCTSLLHA